MINVEYHGDLATLELWLPKYLGVWIENQAKLQKITPRALVKEMLIKVYNSHAQRVTK